MDAFVGSGLLRRGFRQVSTTQQRALGSISLPSRALAAGSEVISLVIIIVLIVILLSRNNFRLGWPR
jgi:hypothetical protein